MKYYAVDPAANGKHDPAEQGHQPERRWVFRTDADGFCEYNTSFLAGGDELYLSPGGVPSLPMGVVTIQETKAPEGLIFDLMVYVIPITSQNNGSEFVTITMPRLFRNPCCPCRLLRKRERHRPSDPGSGIYPYGSGWKEDGCDNKRERQRDLKRAEAVERIPFRKNLCRQAIPKILAW